MYILGSIPTRVRSNEFDSSVLKTHINLVIKLDTELSSVNHVKRTKLKLNIMTLQVKKVLNTFSSLLLLSFFHFLLTL